MALWQNLASFVADQEIERSDLQPLLDNLRVLKNKNYDHRIYDEANGVAQSTTSTTLVDVTNPKYFAEIETEGGDLVVFAAFEARHSVSGGRMALALKVDGEFHTPIDTSSDELAYTVSNFTSEIVVPNAVFIVYDLPAGFHEISFAFRSVDAGTTTLRGNARRLHVAVWEL